jgi:hypothetical protein
MAPELSIATRGFDRTVRGIMDYACSWNLPKGESTSPDRLRAAIERCSDAPSRRASVPSPYSDSYRYCGVQANAMYYRGGDSEWANEVRGCLTCMDEMEVAPHDAHMFCYEEGTKKAGTFWGTVRGYGEAVFEAGKDFTSSLFTGAKGIISDGLSGAYTWIKGWM